MAHYVGRLSMPVVPVFEVGVDSSLFLHLGMNPVRHEASKIPLPKSSGASIPFTLSRSSRLWTAQSDMSGSRGSECERSVGVVALVAIRLQQQRSLPTSSIPHRYQEQQGTPQKTATSTSWIVDQLSTEFQRTSPYQSLRRYQLRYTDPSVSRVKGGCEGLWPSKSQRTKE